MRVTIARLLAIAALVLGGCVPHAPGPIEPPPLPDSCPVCPAVQPAGCPRCPVTPPPPPAAQSNLDGLAVDSTGAPILGAHVTYSGITGDAVTLDAAGSASFCKARPGVCTDIIGAPGFFSRPGSEVAGTYVLHITTRDGRHGDSASIVFDLSWKAKRVTFAVPPIPDPPHAELPPFGPGHTLLGFSYYDVLGASVEVRAIDFQRLHENGFGEIEDWFIWGDLHQSDPDSSVFDSHGNWLPGGADRLKELLDQAQSYGLYVGGRVSACDLWRNDSHDSTVQKQILHSIAARPDIANHPAFLYFDPANESSDRKKGSPKGSLNWCHTSSGEYGGISKLAGQITPKIRLAMSISGPAIGPYEDNHPVPVGPFNCESIAKGAKPLFANAHDTRSPHSGSDTKKYVTDLANALKSCHHPEVPPGLPEPNRRGGGSAGQTANLPLSEFEAGEDGARAAGAVIWVFHTAAGFRDPSKPATDQLDPVELQFLHRVRAH